MIDIRLQKIYNSASKLFINNGYSKTQINHIAKSAGISVGAVYTLFSSKKAIFDFILKCVLDIHYIETEFQFPINESMFFTLQDEIINAFEENAEKFSKAFYNKKIDYHFEEMISDAFDIISRYGTACLLFEKNINDCQNLSNFYFEYRKQFFNTFMDYVNIYIKQGTIRSLEYPEYSARLMIETLSWWAMHIQNDAFEILENIPVEIAKNVCLDAVINAYKK